MQASIIMFWIEFYLISTFCLHAADRDHHSVLDCVGLDIHLLLRAGDLHAFLGGVGFDLHPLLLSLKVIIVRFWIDLIFAFFYVQVITDYHDVLD